MIEWFKHDIHCLQDDKLFALVSRYGAEGYAVYFHTIEAMYANNGEPLTDIAVRRIAFDLGTTFDKAVDILDYASSESCDHLLEQTEAGYISVRVMEECGRHSEKVEKMRRLGKSSAERRRNAALNGTLNDTLNGTSDGAPTKRSTDQTREDKNKNISKYQDNIPSGNLDIDKKSLFSLPDTSHSPSEEGEAEEERKDRVDYQKIMDLYNTLCPSLPRVKILSDARKKAIKARMNSGYKVDDFRLMFQKAEASSFMKGANNRNWTADFDWMIKDANMAKVLDGKYNEDRTGSDGEVTKRFKDYSDIKKEDLEKEFKWK